MYGRVRSSSSASRPQGWVSTGAAGDDKGIVNSRRWTRYCRSWEPTSRPCCSTPSRRTPAWRRYKPRWTCAGRQVRRRLCRARQSLDVGKAVAVLATNPATCATIWNRKIKQDGLPIITIPTTAGTAAEITDVSVLSDHSAQQSDDSQPAVAPSCADGPALTLGCSSVTRDTGMDALTHAVESLSTSMPGRRAKRSPSRRSK